MTTIHKSAIVIYTPAQMYTLVDDIDAYCQFLPWCKSSAVLSRAADNVEARLEIAYSKLNKSFTTRNRHVTHQSIEMQLLEGPFRHLRGLWTFIPLGDEGSKITFQLEFEFSNALLALTIGPVFSQIANSMVDAFTQRAKNVYG